MNTKIQIQNFVNQIRKNELFWIIFLIAITWMFGLSIQENMNGSSFVYDSTYYLNVVNSLREGYGFSMLGLFPSYNQEPNSGEWIISYSPYSIMNDNEQLRNPYAKPPLYFVLLAGFLEIFSADYSNWIFLSSVFNIVISTVFVLVYYYFCRKNFGILVGVFSSFLLVTSTVFILSTTDTRMYPLVFLLIISSFLFLKRETKHYFIFGVLSALASLTHTLAISTIVTYACFLLIKKELRGFLIMVGTWFIILLPWMKYQLDTYGDFGKSLGIPFSENISTKIFGTKIIDPLPNISSATLGHIMPPFEMMYNWLLTPGYWDYNQDIIVFFSLFSIFSIISFKILKIGLLKNWKKYVLSICLIVLVIFSLNFLDTLSKTIIQLCVLLFIPITILYILKIKTKIFVEDIPRVILVTGFFIIITIIAQFFATSITLTAQPLVGFPMLIILLPLGIIGFKELFGSALSGKIGRYKNQVNILIIISIIVIPSIFFISAAYSFAEKYSNLDDKNIPKEETFAWIRENINKNSVLMGYEPTNLFLGTGNPTVPLAISYNVPYAVRTYVEKFNIEYLVTGTSDNIFLVYPAMLGLKQNSFDLAYKKIYQNADFSVYKIDYSQIKEKSWFIFDGIYLEETGKNEEAVKKYEVFLNDPDRQIFNEDDSKFVYYLLLSAGWKTEYNPNNVIGVETFTKPYDKLIPNEINLKYEVEKFEKSTDKTLEFRKKVIERLISEFRIYEKSIETMMEEITKMEESGDMESINNMYKKLEKIDSTYFKSLLIKFYDELLDDKIVENNQMKKNYVEYQEMLRETLKNNLLSSEDKNKIKEKLVSSFKSEIKRWKESGKLNKLLTTYTNWISFDQFNKEANLGYAQTLEELGEIKRAISAYEFVLKLASEDEQKEIEKKIEILKDQILS